MSSDSRRLQILTNGEIDDLYALPSFTDEDRLLYFDLSAVEKEAVDATYTISVGAHLILQLGYFKAKRQVFRYKQESVLDDLRYIIELYFPGTDLADLKIPSKPVRLEQKKAVPKIFDYRLCDTKIQLELEQKAQRLAMLSTQPSYILREAMQYLAHQRIVAPSYRFMQEMIGRVMAAERRRITQLLGKALTTAHEKQLDELLKADEGMYRITAFKHEAMDFSYKELRSEVERRKFFQPLYEFSQQFLETSGISSESVKYYASLVKFYTVFKLQRMAISTTRLYLICFAYHRFRQINDSLIDAFIHWVDKYENQAKIAAEAAMHNALADASENLKAAGQVLNLFVDLSIPSDASFTMVKEKAFSMLDPERFSQVSDYMRNIAFDKEAFVWSYWTKLSLTFKRNLRQLFTDLSFAGRVEDAPLLEAVTFLQNILRQGKSLRQVDPSTFPIALIPKNLQRHLFVTIEDEKDKKLVVDRYEFLVYRCLRKALESGDVFVGGSTEYRRFEDDLISDIRWQNKDFILNDIGSPVLLTPIRETLNDFQISLEKKITAVNQRIANGLNKHIKIIGSDDKRRWKLIHPSTEEPVSHQFYDQLPGISLPDLLWFVAKNTGFFSSFTHVLDRYVKQNAEPHEILACIVAMGTNMGLSKMAEVSGLTSSSLITTTRNYVRLETLHEANNAISNAIAALPLFKLFNIHDSIHSSSDGQRMETQINTINSRYSPKYFGLHKGVSSYTLIANHVPINAKIIGTHEHESHYVFDLLYNNTSDIKPERHSTDTHGTNQVNFWILHTFGYDFAPRYRDLHKKMSSLVGFKHPSQYDSLIKPSRKANLELIESEWPNIQRIMASLAQKDVTQATIVRKLSSYSRQNKTMKALWELENICRTLYILDFIDDVELRQNVQKALNRGEAYHRFRRAIAYVNGGKFHVKT